MDYSAMQAPQPGEILQSLIRFDTTNPPGDEAACIGYIRDLLTQHNIPSQLVIEPVTKRSNLVARIKGRGDAKPLMLYGHADVVTTEHQQWQRPPFSGDLADGYIWGRGALDMKGGLAMMLSAVLGAATAQTELSGDVLFVVVSDEESGGTHGAKFLVEQHPDLFTNVGAALCEFGGFTQYVGGKRFYPIQVAEKIPCKLRAVIHGRGGHSAMYIPGNTMALLGTFLTRLNHHLLPIHITDTVRQFISGIANQQSPTLRFALRGLLNPRLTDQVMRVASRVQPQITDLVPMLRNTVNATIVQAGLAKNVVPEEAVVDLDARLMPGFTPDQLLSELRAAIGMNESVEYEITKWEAIPTTMVDAAIYRLLAEVIKRADPVGTPLPLLLNGSTDGRHFAKLGIQSYGFTPMKLPPDFSFLQTIHAANERIPVDALNFGVACLFDVLQSYEKSG